MRLPHLHWRLHSNLNAKAVCDRFRVDSVFNRRLIDLPEDTLSLKSTWNQVSGILLDLNRRIARQPITTTPAKLTALSLMSRESRGTADLFTVTIRERAYLGSSSGRIGAVKHIGVGLTIIRNIHIN